MQSKFYDVRNPQKTIQFEIKEDEGSYFFEIENISDLKDIKSIKSFVRDEFINKYGKKFNNYKIRISYSRNYSEPDSKGIIYVNDKKWQSWHSLTNETLKSDSEKTIYIFTTLQKDNIKNLVFTKKFLEKNIISQKERDSVIDRYTNEVLTTKYNFYFTDNMGKDNKD